MWKFIGLAILLFLAGCSRPVSRQASSSSTQAAQNDDLFEWSRPIRFPINLPIAQSATCSFKKSVGVAFHAADPSNPDDANSRLFKGISYSVSDEDEADTVAFIDLDTRTPKVRSNNGQATLRVLYNDEYTVTVAHTVGSTTEMYTVFRRQGVVIYSQHQNAEVIGPFGVIEMGYCN